MMTENRSWTKDTLALSGDRTFQLEVAQIRAKALLREVSDVIPPYRWSYVASRVVRNLTATLFSLETLSRTYPDRLKELEDAARQFALTWESLAKLGERTSRDTALMSSAVAYELAGYQANAVCLARQLGRDFYEIDKPDVSELTSAFLQRLFLQVRLLANRVRKEPEVNRLTYLQLLEDTSLALAGEGFAFASRFFLGGDENALAIAMKSLEEAEQSFASLGRVVESNLVRSIRSLLPLMRQRTTWSVFGKLVRDNPRWKRYLKLLARGPGFDILRSPSVSELWPSQIYALEKGLLDSESSKVIRMPTSSGKTRIAELAIVYTLVTIPDARCVYVAPYRALVWELEQAFLNLFSDLGYRVSSVIGTYESDDFEELLAADADILIMTPEKLDLLQRAQPEFLDNVRLIVLDEGQIVHDQQRGVKFELLLTRLKRRLPNARFLFISAVFPQETLEDFARWFKASPEDDVLSLDWRPSIQRYAKFEWIGETGVIRHSSSEDIELLQEFVPGVTKQQIYEFVNPLTRRINRRRFPDPNNKAQIAAELAYKFADLGPVLVFCSQTNFAEAVAKSLEMRLDLSKRKGESIPSYFLNASSTRSVLSAQEWLGDNHAITRFLKKGIAIHHGKIPDTLRKSIELDFRDKQFRILVATNTLAQGVNLPIRTVIIHSCWRYIAEGRYERIPARDYWNIAGRAGRAGQETEGTIIHIVRNRSDERDYRYYLRHRKEVEPVESALFRLLKNLLDERLDELLTKSALSETLDPEILALLVEEGPEFLLDENLQKLLSETLVQAQANRSGIGTEKIRQVFQETSEDIINLVPEKSYWPIYSSTGLSSKSCEAIRNYVVENRDRVSTLLREGSPAQVDNFVMMFLDACLTLPEMQPDREFGGSYNELLKSWLNGVSIHELVAEFGDQTTSLEELAKLIEELFAFRLPWGISAFIRIAAKELELQSEELCNFATFFPTMVKFGVPNPVACWAISAGMPYRKTGIDIAAKYLEETSSPNFQEFIEWIGDLNSEDLRYTFGLKGPVLEDVSRALSRSSFNPLLKKFATSEEILPYQTYVRGIAFENRIIVASEAQVGQSVDLIRDYDNPVDHNAVKVQLNGRTLGYLHRQLAQLVAPDMDCGLSLKGTIVEIKRTEIPRIKIRIDIQPSN